MFAPQWHLSAKRHAVAVLRGHRLRKLGCLVQARCGRSEAKQARFVERTPWQEEPYRKPHETQDSSNGCGLNLPEPGPRQGVSLVEERLLARRGGRRLKEVFAMKIHAITAILLGSALGFAGTVWAQSEGDFAPENTPVTINGIEAVCDGTGIDSRDAHARTYPMHIEFVGKDGQYLGDERITLTGNGVNM